MTTIFEVLAQHPITQTWDEHTAKGKPGGVDWDMPMGTFLPAPSGDTITIETSGPWYNSGLGLAVAYVRADGCRTVYAHGSRIDGWDFYSGNSGTSTGPHVHIHDVLPDGGTRAYPFSTITSTAGGDLAPFDPQEVPEMKEFLRIIQTPQKQNKAHSDWWVVNLADHTYYHIENMTQKNWLVALGVLEVVNQQDPAVLAGFRWIDQ